MTRPNKRWKPESYGYRIQRMKEGWQERRDRLRLEKLAAALPPLPHPAFDPYKRVFGIDTDALPTICSKAASQGPGSMTTIPDDDRMDRAEIIIAYGLMVLFGVLLGWIAAVYFHN